MKKSEAFDALKYTIKKSLRSTTDQNTFNEFVLRALVDDILRDYKVDYR